MNKVQIAVLITCHNKRDTTLRCLGALMGQKLIDDIDLRVYLVDAGCSDGTAQAVREDFPQVNVIIQDESLYWCNGMRLAFAEAIKSGYDYYMWLNNDTMLVCHAVRHLLDTALEIYQLEGRHGIIVGSTKDPETGQHTYGGVTQTSKLRPFKFCPVEPSGQPQRCATMNGNCVLVPASVVSIVGNLSSEFTHAIGDTDYGLRARAKGVSIWVAGQYVGTCRRDCPPEWTNPHISLHKRLEIMRSPKGMPVREWLIFSKRHAGFLWPVHVLSLYLHLLFPKRRCLGQMRETNAILGDE